MLKAKLLFYTLGFPFRLVLVFYGLNPGSLHWTLFDFETVALQVCKLPEPGSNLRSSYHSLPKWWEYRCAPPCQVDFHVLWCGSNRTFKQAVSSYFPLGAGREIHLKRFFELFGGLKGAISTAGLPGLAVQCLRRSSPPVLDFVPDHRLLSLWWLGLHSWVFVPSP